jgi:hypothetical protein
MQFNNQIIIKRWRPILEEYEKIISKINPRSFKFVKDLCKAHNISAKEFRRYYRKWLEGNKQDESLLPKKRGAPPGSRRTPKEIERNIIKAYRRFGSNRYELVLLFKPYYLDKTPSPATMDRIKARYPLNRQNKKIIKQKDLIMNLGNFLFEYNHLRKHGNLNYETPFDKLQKVTELLS